MTGYVRQSSADIIATAVVRATPLNNEFNAIRDSFAQSGGHKHDGTAAEGEFVPQISDTANKNKVVTDTVNNRVGVFVNVSGTATEQVRFQNGAVLPVTTNTVDFGSSSYKIKDFYAAGNIYLATASLTGQLTSTVATGTAPLVVASTTKVANLNADLLDGNDWVAPAAIGTTTPAAGTFTTLTANTSLTAASAAISAGTINGTVIGGSTAQAITGTTVTATTGFVGGLTGAVTGNTTGTHTGAVVGNVTGDLTGNVSASTGTSSFNDVTINGGLNMNAGTAATITNLTTPTNSGDAATKGYVDTSISNLVASAPSTLDTLNEIATALGNDANLSTTLTNSIATKLALAGGTMSGAIAMGTNKITGLGNPTANQDAATKTYVDTADALQLNLTGGTMSGAIAMGTNKITGLGTPTAGTDATTKTYVDGILGSATAAATSAAAAATSASNAATSESNASTSASSASTSATNAAASYDSFDDRYLGSKTSAPSVDNDGNALLTGALYWNSTSSNLFLWTGSAWTQAAFTASGFATLTGAETLTNKTLTFPVIDNPQLGYTTTATAAGTTTLTVTSNHQQFFTGSTTQTIVLPVTSTLALGVSYSIENNSTGTLTVQSSGLNTITTIPSGVTTLFTCILTSGTTTASWDYDQIGFATLTGTGANVLGTAPTISNLNITTGLTIASAAGTAGQALLSGGTGAAPTWGTAGVSAGKAIAFAMVMGF